MLFDKTYISFSYCLKRNYVEKRNFFRSTYNVYYRKQPCTVPRKILFFAVAHVWDRAVEIIKCCDARSSPSLFHFFPHHPSEGASRRPTPGAARADKPSLHGGAGEDKRIAQRTRSIRSISLSVSLNYGEMAAIPRTVIAWKSLPRYLVSLHK